MKRNKPRIQTANVLCLDPSLTAFGWSVVSDFRVLARGCIRTEKLVKKLKIRKGDDDVRRISEINTKLKEIIEQYRIVFIVSELPHGSQSSSAANALGMVKGELQTISDFMNIGLEWYSEAEAKKAVLGKHASTKTEMIESINKLFEVNWEGIKYVDEAVADSLAIYYVASQQSPVLKYLAK